MITSEKPTVETHRFTGMFRPPFEQIKTYLCMDCPCGRTVMGVPGDTPRDHWLAGHFDVPQYEPLKAAGR